MQLLICSDFCRLKRNEILSRPKRNEILTNYDQTKTKRNFDQLWPDRNETKYCSDQNETNFDQLLPDWNEIKQNIICNKWPNIGRNETKQNFDETKTKFWSDRYKTKQKFDLTETKLNEILTTPKRNDNGPKIFGHLYTEIFSLV